MPDEHASEFAETLAGLKSGDVETSDSEKGGFADIIDEKFIPGHTESVLHGDEIEQEKRDRYIQHFLIASAILWFIIDTESFLGVLFWLL